MRNNNIRYRSEEILKFYKESRQSWADLYPSEKRIFETVAGKDAFLGDVLDVGCACGGLARALSEKLRISSYTGIDIHKDSIDWALASMKLDIPVKFIAADIVEHVPARFYDTVVSLGCADWNIETLKIIDSCWKNVKKGGHFIVSLRLTGAKGVNDIKKSYQMINFSGTKKKPEIANYVVLNFNEAVEILTKLAPGPQLIGAYGYWGKPSSMAVTPFEKIVFSVFYLKKGARRDSRADMRMSLDLPDDLFNAGAG